MKRLGWGVLTALLVLSAPMPAFALGTSPSTAAAVKVSGPFLITGYSFSGHSLRYAQIYNVSSSVASLNGWSVSVEQNGSQQIYASLAGLLAPGKYITVGDSSFVPTATFTFSDFTVASDPVLTSISMLAPAGSNYNNEVATIQLSPSTLRVLGNPATFYFNRNISNTTGNYLSTYSAFIPGDDFSLVSDGLYQVASTPGISIVELYPDALDCSPFDTSLLCKDYVKLYNDSSMPIDLSLFRIRTGSYGQVASPSNTAVLMGILESGHFVSVPVSLNQTGNWVWLEDTYGIQAYQSTAIVYPSATGYDNQAWSFDVTSDTWKWTIIPTPSDASNSFPVAPTINQCAGAKLSEIAANVASEDQFVEITNISNNPIDLAGCALETNRSATNQYVFTNTVVPPGDFISVYIKDTELTLTKTTSGTVYLLSSDLATEIDASSYDNLSENTSWALNNNDWTQTYAVTPNASNIILDYPACADGYVRNSETGNCNKTPTLTSALSECGPGKYRNTDTNRCRTLDSVISAAASLLTPCAANQERNPATNRCRLVTASASELKPCAANQERNPSTNRCRNLTTNAAKSDFPVEAVVQGSQATLGWWAFGGVGTLAAGYAGWEWRREVTIAIKRAAQFVTSKL